MSISPLRMVKEYEAPQVKAFVNMDDKTIQRIAWAQTMGEVDVNKHKRLNAALDMALPLAGGLSAAAYAAKGTRAAEFAKGTGRWALFLTGIVAVFGLAKAAASRNEKLNNFMQDHPILNFLGLATAGYFAGRGMTMGGAKLLDKLRATGSYKKMADNVNNFAKKLGETKIMKNISKKITETIAKTPSPLKSIAKGVANWSPILLVMGSLIHSANFKRKTANLYNENYSNLKEMQLDAARNQSFKS